VRVRLFYISFRAPAITAIARLVPTGDAFTQIAINMAGETKSTESRYHRFRVPP